MGTCSVGSCSTISREMQRCSCHVLQGPTLHRNADRFLYVCFAAGVLYRWASHATHAMRRRLTDPTLHPCLFRCFSCRMLDARSRFPSPIPFVSSDAVYQKGNRTVRTQIPHHHLSRHKLFIPGLRSQPLLHWTASCNANKPENAAGYVPMEKLRNSRSVKHFSSPH